MFAMLRNHKISLSDLYDQLSPDTQHIFRNLLCQPALIKKIDTDYKNTLVTKISRKEAQEFLNQNESSTSNLYSFIFMQDKNGFRTPYVISDLIGRGGNGIIKHAYNLITGEHVALKIDRGYSCKTEKERANEFDCEKDVLINYSHGYRDELIRVGHHDRKIFYLAQEFIVGETLEAYMNNDLSDTLSATPRTSLRCAGIAKTVMEIIGISLINLTKLHNMDYVHRDLKPSNIMVIKNKEGLLHEFDSEIQDTRFIDFGSTDKNSGAMRSISLGTFAYLPPELKQNEDLVAFTKKSDIYSLGLIFMELFNIIAGQDICKINLFFRAVPAYKVLISSLKSFLDLMLAEDPQQRIDADTALLNFYNMWDKWQCSDNNKDIRPDISLTIIRNEFLNQKINSMKKRLIQ